MRTYLEASEIIEMMEGIPEFIRADVTDMEESAIVKIKDAIVDTMSGKTYKLTMHYCNHDEGGSCTSEQEI